MYSSTLLAWAAAAATTAQAAYIGFNYGSTFTDGSAKQQADFEAEFNSAKSLAGTNGEFTSARLYTMIQGGTADTPISAIPAAIDTKTTLLLGLWASAGQADFTNEVTALTSAITQYGTAFTSLIAGISVGSEDLYRVSPTGILNLAGAGANPADLVNYINQVRSAISGTSASGASIGHVDTWTAWVNGSNDAVINAVDWLGMDAYPYFQNTIANSIDVGNSTLFDAYDNTVGAAQGKPVWVTETGWPVSGPQENQAIASTQNAETYWQQVGCTLFGQINTWWYVLQDALPTTPSPSFGIITDSSNGPLYDLTCNNGKKGATSSSAASSSKATSSAVSTAVSATMPVSSAGANTESVAQGTPGPEVSPTSVSISQSSASSAAPTSTSQAHSSASASASAAPSASSYVSSPIASAPVATSVVSASGSGGNTYTTKMTTLMTVTNCPSGCPSSQASTAPVASSSCSSGTCSPIWTTFGSGASSVATVSSASAGSGMVSQIADGQIQAPTPSAYTSAAPAVSASTPAASAPAVSASPSAPAPVASSSCTTCSPVWTTFGSTSAASAPAVTPSTGSASASIVSTASPSPATSSATTPAVPSGTSCPANLNGAYQYPHLIVPVDSANPDKAYGTQYNGTITPTISTIFNFDLPASYAGKTCSLVFLFPTQAALETSAYTFNGKGGLTVNELSAPATEQTTYNTVPKAAVSGIGSIQSLQPGGEYVVASHECAAGARQSFEFMSTGGLDLSFFQDYNPSPLGAYITVC